MADDLYNELLGIPPGPRPPNHYVILGLPLFEAEPHVIHEAVLRQISELKRYVLHPDPERMRRVQDLLNEVARAGTTLEDPTTKGPYDVALAQQLGVSPLAPEPVPQPQTPIDIPAIRPAPMAPDWVCLSCGTPLGADDDKCPVCGHGGREPSGPDEAGLWPPLPEAARRERAQPRTFDPRRVALACVGAIVCILALAVVARFWRASPEPESRTKVATAVQTVQPQPVSKKQVPPPDRGAARRLEADSAYQSALLYEAERPADREGIARRFREVRAKYPDTAAGYYAGRKLDELDGAERKRRQAQLDAARQRARDLAAKNRFGEALAQFDELLKENPPEDVRHDVLIEKTNITAYAERAYEDIRRRAREKADAGQYEDAAALYEQVAAAFGLEPFASRAKGEMAVLGPLLKAAKDRVATSLAEPVYGREAKAVLAHLTARELPEARKLADAAVANPTLAPLREEARNLQHLNNSPRFWIERGAT